VWAYDPEAVNESTTPDQAFTDTFDATQSLLRKRYKFIEDVRLARTVGLIYGTVSLQQRSELHDELERLLR